MCALRKAVADRNSGLRRLATRLPRQWLYQIGDDGVVFSEEQSRFAGLDATAVSAYLAFDAGATPEDLRACGPHTRSTVSRNTMAAIYALSQGIFPAEDGPVDWPPLQNAPIANIALHNVPVLIEFPPRPVDELCRDVFRNCPAAAKPAAYKISAERATTGWAIHINGGEILSSLADEQLGLGFLHAARSVLYAASRYDVAFHAAMVGTENCGIMLSAPREAGKSTLSAYLLSHGFDLLADEPTLLQLDTGCVSSLSLPISLKRKSWTVLRNDWPTLEQAPIHVRSDGTKIRLLHPPSASRSTISRRLTRIVFPEYPPSGAACIEQISPLQALRLANDAGMVLARYFSRSKFEAFLELLCTIPAYRLRYASLSEAFSSISRLVNEA